MQKWLTWKGCVTLQVNIALLKFDLLGLQFMQEHSDVEQQNYYLKSDAIEPSGVLHQLSLPRGHSVLNWR